MKKPWKISLSHKRVLKKRSRVSQVVASPGVEPMRGFGITPEHRYFPVFISHL